MAVSRFFRNAMAVPLSLALLGGEAHAQNEYLSYALPEVKAGRLEYTRNCGWVDWGHAIPSGPQRLLRTILNESGENSVGRKYHEVLYGQYMRKEIPATNSSIIVGVEGRYRIRRGLSRTEKIRVAYAIFKDISHRFEKFQGSGVVGVIATHSSFAEEDLPSNLISFQRANLGYSRRDIEKMCRPLGQEQSENLMTRGYYGERNESMNPILRLKGRFPKQLRPPIRPKNNSYFTLSHDIVYKTE